MAAPWRCGRADRLPRRPLTSPPPGGSGMATKQRPAFHVRWYSSEPGGRHAPPFKALDVGGDAFIPNPVGRTVLAHRRRPVGPRRLPVHQVRRRPRPGWRPDRPDSRGPRRQRAGRDAGRAKTLFRIANEGICQQRMQLEIVGDARDANLPAAAGFRVQYRISSSRARSMSVRNLALPCRSMTGSACRSRSGTPVHAAGRRGIVPARR